MRAVKLITAIVLVVLLIPVFLNGQTAASPSVQDGAVNGLPSTPNWTIEGNQAGALFGWSVASAGDVNGDGYADVIVGANSYSNGQTQEGRAYVYYGSATGLSAIPDWTAESNQTNAFFGDSVASAGDVNGDGYADVIVGANDYDNGQTDEGRAYVYHGSATGLSATPNWTAESDQASAYFGEAVASAGDVNGDGFSDVIVGAYQYDNGQTNEGRAYVYYGSAGGLSATPNWTAEGNQAEAYFGEAVASAGNVNGDGYVDVIVGARHYSNGQTWEGRAYVYYGSAGGLSSTPAWTAESNQASAEFGSDVASAGDVNGDSFGDVIVGALGFSNGQTGEGRAYVYHGSTGGLGATPAWTAESNQAGASFGYPVASAGDLNSDGYADVIVGAPLYDNGQTNEGRAYMYQGSAGGLSTTPNWTAEGDQGLASFGFSAGTAGNVNGDCCDDVIVGAYGYDNDQVNEGRAYSYYGWSGGVLIGDVKATNDSPTRLGEPTKLIATVLGGGEGVTYDWDFGDGSLHGQGRVVTHEYPDIGQYTATVTAHTAWHQRTDTTTVIIGFMDLPFTYDGTAATFADLANGYYYGANDQSRLMSWFDHHYPTAVGGDGDGTTMTWIGETYTGVGAGPCCRENCYDNHDALDFRPSGDNAVYPVAPGRVYHTSTGCGEVVITHTNSAPGFASVYYHLATIDVDEGDPVDRDTQIGTIGSSCADAVHLHTTVLYDADGPWTYQDGRQIDYFGWLSERFDINEPDPCGTSTTCIPSRGYLWAHPLHRQWAVGAVGASFFDISNKAQVAIPPRAINAWSPVTVELWDAPPAAVAIDGRMHVGSSFWLLVPEWFSLSSTHFNKPVTLRVAYDAYARCVENSTTLYYWEDVPGGTNPHWIALTTKRLAGTNILEAQTDRVGSFSPQCEAQCPADRGEPDDPLYTTPRVALSPDGSPSARLFDVPQDEDWFVFEALAGKTYLIQTGNLAKGVGTIVQIYKSGGATLLAEGKNGAEDGTSRLEWQAPADGRYLIRAAAAPGSKYGCDATYELWVMEVE